MKERKFNLKEKIEWQKEHIAEYKVWVSVGPRIEVRAWLSLDWVAEETYCRV